jgi:hypothetical protein
MFLMLTLYMQQVLGYSAMKTGVAYLAVAGTSIIWANVAAALVNKVGVRPLIASGMAILTVGLVLFTQVSVGGSYAADLLPGFLIIALGMALCFVPISIAALAGVSQAEAGIASGLINTSQQIGGGGHRRAAGDDVGLPARLLGRCWDRARRRRRRPRVDPAGGARSRRRARGAARVRRRLEPAQYVHELRGAADDDVGGLA